MKTTPILLLLIILLPFSIQAQRPVLSYYKIVSEHDYYSTRSNRKCIVIPVKIKTDQIGANSKDPDYVVSWAFYMCEDRNYVQLQQYIREHSTQNADTLTDLIAGIYFFSTGNFPAAIISLNKYKGSRFQFMKYLLLGDTKYQMLNNKYEWPETMAYFQLAYDHAKNHEFKKLIIDRIQWVRYQQ